MKRQLFQEKTGREPCEKIFKGTDLGKLVEIQALALATTYHTTCFDVKQLQEVLGVGETNVYRLLKTGKLSSVTIGRRKIVPVSALAQFLVMSEKSS